MDEPLISHMVDSAPIDFYPADELDELVKLVQDSARRMLGFEMTERELRCAVYGAQLYIGLLIRAYGRRAQPVDYTAEQIHDACGAAIASLVAATRRNRRAN